MKHLESFELTELNHQEMTTIEGGNPAVIVALAAVSPIIAIAALCLGAFMAGYYIGKAIF